MGLDDLEFFICQPSGFIEDLVINADFSNIVKCRCCNDHPAHSSGKIIFIRLLDQSLKNQFCNNVDMQYMRAALSITELYDLA